MGPAAESRSMVSFSALSVCGIAMLCMLGWVPVAAAQELLPTPAEQLGYPATGYPSTGFEAPPLIVEPEAVVPPTGLPAMDITPIEPVPNRLPAPASPPIAPVPQPAQPLSPPVPSAALPAVVPSQQPLATGELEPPPEADPFLTDPAIAPVTWYRPRSWFGPAPWDTGVELGINGSSGTSNTLSIRTGGYIKRKTDVRKIDFNLYYNKTNAEGVDTQNNAQLNFRHDWLLGDSPWSVYFNNQIFYDEFQAFDLNVNVNTGIGYTWFDDDWISLTTRYGSGASREFGGPADRWKPEAQFGADYEQKISATQKFYAKVDYFPEWESFGDYRILADMGLEVQLQVPSNVSLKIAATDRYTSNPNGVQPHNVNYSVLLLWKH